MSSPLSLSFVLYAYFPYGGLQRDFMRLLNECLARGHRVEVYTLRWEGEAPAGVTIHLAPVKALTRPRLYRKFSRWLDQQLAVKKNHTVVGFNKMPGLDVYYAADPCFAEIAEEQRGGYYRHTGRYRHFSDYENAVFGRDSGTEVLYLSPAQRHAFTQYYEGCENRLHALPAGLAEDRRLAERSLEGRAARKAEARAALATELGIAEEATLLLQVGSGFKIKGVDRALVAIAALPPNVRDSVHYLLVGSDKPGAFIAQAKKLGIAAQVTIVQGRDDVPALLAAADLMLHPAYRESAGYTLVEAVVAGLPVLTTASCGYAFHVHKARAGLVCSEPFVQSELSINLSAMLALLPDADWSANGLAYGANDDLYRLPSAAVDFIERFEQGIPRGS